MLKNVQSINAKDIPPEFVDYCMSHDIQLHYDNSIVELWNDGSGFVEWLKSIGFLFSADSAFSWLGIWGD